MGARILRCSVAALFVAGVGLGRVAGRRARGRLRVVAALVAFAVVGSAVGVASPVVAADPALPAGGTSSPPVQRVGSVGVPVPASTAATQGRPGAGVPAGRPPRSVPALDPRPEDRVLTPQEAAVWAERAAALRDAAEYGIPLEVVSARGARFAEYANPDGTLTRRMFDSVTHVSDAAGGMVRVDGTLTPRAGDGRLQPAAAMGEVSFAPVADDAALARWHVGDGVVVGFGLTGAASVPVALGGSVARFPGVRTDADVELSADGEGVKETLVLHSPAAPRVWEFPLLTQGVAPVLDPTSGAVLLVDGHERVVAVIPPGFMEDSRMDPVSGEWTQSSGVAYELVQRDGGWVLRVVLDSTWLADPARVWPVRVDPSVWNAAPESDDTFVSSNDYASQNNSARSELLIGTYNSGGEKSNSFVHFTGAMAALAGTTIVSAKLKLYNHWSYTCIAKPSSVHKVTASWAGSSTTTYPGPSYEATALATSTFSYGYSACPTPGWGSYTLPVNRVQAWVNGSESFYGLTVRASLSDSTQWKRFRSANYSTASLRPYLEVTYNYPIGVSAVAPAPNAIVDTITPTLWAEIADPSGSTTKQYKFSICAGPPESPGVCANSGSSWQSSATWKVPAGIVAWGGEATWQVNVSNGSVESGWKGPYVFSAQVAQPPVTAHLADAPEGGEVPGVNPQVGNYTTAVTDASVAVVGPALSAVRTYNSQDPRSSGMFGRGWSSPWDQKVVVDTDGSGNVVVTLASGRQVRFGRNADGSYSPPSGQNLTLVYGGTPPMWTLRDPAGYRRVFDGVTGRLSSVADADGRTQTYAYGALSGNLALSKAASGSAACNSNEGPEKAVNGSVSGGNSDKWCSTTAPRWWSVDLGTSQSVGAVIVRHAEAGGESASWNTRGFSLEVSTDNINWTVVATETANTSAVTIHQFPATTARYVRLNVTTPTQDGNAAARIYEVEVYTGLGELTTVTDTASGRALHLSWQGGRVSSVVTDPPAAGQPAPTWSYSYTDGRLIGVCTPLGPQACTSYTYLAPSSHYRSVVLDERPVGYWPLGETSGTVAANVAAASPAQFDATYTAVTLGAAGGLAGSTDPAASFSAGSSSVVSLPTNLVNTTTSMAVELWFKAASGTSGVLWSMQGSSLATLPPNGWVPVLYVGTDGKLRAQVWTPVGGATPITTAGTVTNSAWHHAVLSASLDHQELYLDGVLVGQITGRVINHLTMSYGFIGNGYAKNWPSAPTATANFPFTGQLDEVAYYAHPLGPTQVAAHWAARTATVRLASMVEPGPFTATTVTYDGATGRVTGLTDRHGAVWTLSAATLVGDPPTRQVTISSTVRSSVTYSYDPQRNGRVISRTAASQPPRTWSYNDQGFLAAVTDENANTTSYVTDTRGNVTEMTRCRVPGNPASDCHTAYFGYYLNGADPLDPRNDVQVWSADARSANASDLTYRTTRTLDSAGRVLSITYPKPAGQPVNPVETFTYTNGTGGVPPGLLASHTARNGGVTSHGYTTAGDLLTTTDPVGLVTSYTHDAVGRVSSATGSASVGGQPVSYGTTSYTYNGLSQPLTITEPAIHNPVTDVWHTATTTFGYDNAGRPTSQASSDPSGGDATRTTSWVYDPAGRLTSTTMPDGASTTQSWDAAGDLVGATLPGGLGLIRVFDDEHHLVSVTATGAGVDPMNPAATTLVLQTRGYDPAGRLAVEFDAMGRTTSYTYTGDDLPASTTVARDPAPDLVVAQYTYDGAGHPATLTEAGGLVTATSYDPAGNLATSTVDPGGLARVSTHSYNPDSSVHHSTATGAASPARTERVDHTYDAAGRLLSATVDNTGGSPAALTTTLTRDPRGLVTRETDPTGIATDHTYDLAGRLATTTGAARSVWQAGVETTGVAPVTTLGYNTFGEATQQHDPNGAVTTTGFDPMGRPVSQTLPAYTPPGGSPITATRTTGYNARGWPTTSTDSLGNVTTLTYDPYGHVLSRTQPDPDGGGPLSAPVWTYAYTRTGELAQSTDPVGAVALATYDELRRAVTATSSERVGGSPVYFTTTLGYNDASQVTSSTTPLGHATTMAYNLAGELTRTTDATGRFVATSYDLAGRAVATVSGQNTSYAGPVHTTSFDLAGRPVSTSDCTASATGGCASVLRTRTATFDAAGRTTAVSSPEGRPTFYGYDSAGQLATITQRVDPALPATAVTVGLGYDRVGNRTRLVDGNGNPTSYTFNPWHLVESTIEPATTAHPDAADRTWTSVYNTAGFEVEQRAPGGVVRTRTFDNLGRLVTETGSGAQATTAARTLGYDPRGLVVSATSPAGDHSYTWSDRGLLASATGYGGTASYTYNADAQLTGRVDSAGSATFSYDNAGRLASVADPLTAVTATVGYDSAGRLAQLSYGTGGPTRTLGYDSLGRLASDTTRRPDATITAATSYDYDDDDLLVQKTITGLTGAGGHFYSYDGLSRLISWLDPAGATTSYGYDNASNRTSVTTTAGTRSSTFDQRNRITATTGAGLPADSYVWTARGTLVSATIGAQTTSYTFDAFERLTQVQKTGGYTVSLSYDSLDRPAQRNGVGFAYHDLTNTPIKAPTAAGEAKLLRDPTGTALSAQTGTDPARLLLGDRRHTDLAALLDPATGDPTSSAGYDPWGTPTGATSLPLGFQGGWTDPDTGLTNAHARWYHPGLGGFTSRDTWTLPPDPVTQTNRYLYANANPLTHTDPTGHAAWMDDPENDGNAKVDTRAPRPRYTSHRITVPKARYLCGASVACQENPTTSIIAPTSPPPPKAVAPPARQPQNPFLAFVSGVRDGWNNWGQDTLDGITSFVKDPVGSLKQLNNKAQYWDDYYGTNSPMGATPRGWFCALSSACEVYEDLRAGNYYEAGYTTGGIAVDVTITVATAGAGAEVAASSRGLRLVAKLCSFTATTLVVMADGTTKTIATIDVGDDVTTTTPDTGTTTQSTVTATHIHTDTDLVDLTITTPDGHHETLHTTHDHPFWDATQHVWVPAGRLQPGHQLLTPSAGRATVAATTRRLGEQRMYNLTIATTHTYHVMAGETPVLVHNSCGELHFPASGVDDATHRQITDLVDIYDANGGRLPDYIARGGGPHHVFENRPLNATGQPVLPVKPYGYYTEADVWALNPNAAGTNATRGAPRLIFGNGGEVYYSPNHYDPPIIRLR